MLAQLIKDYRAAHGLSQEELAVLVGVSRQLVSLIEIGHRRITAEEASKWERKTGIPRAKLRPDIFGKAVA